MNKTTTSSMARILKLLVKIVVPIVCLWYVSGKIDFAATQQALSKANWLYLLLAALAFIISKIFSSLRLNIYFRNIAVNISEIENLRLYWLGMFYNLFLPGAISGDAYKVVLLAKRYDTGYKKGSAAVLLDRFSGLLGLGLLLGVYGLLLLPSGPYPYLLFAGSLMAVGVFYLLVIKWFKDFIPGFWPTLFWGLAVQGMQVLCAYLIMASLGIPMSANAYIFLFLASSLASVLPLSIGGLGIREIVFLEGSAFFGLPEEKSVLISLLFYLITLLTSFGGIYYVFKDPLKTKKDPNESLNL